MPQEVCRNESAFFADSECTENYFSDQHACGKGQEESRDCAFDSSRLESILSAPFSKVLTGWD